MNMTPSGVKNQPKIGELPSEICKRNSTSSLDSWEAVFDFECACDAEILTHNSASNTTLTKPKEIAQKRQFKMIPNIKGTKKGYPYDSEPPQKQPSEDSKKSPQKLIQNSKAKPLREKYVTAVLGGHSENKYVVSNTAPSQIKPGKPPLNFVPHRQKTYRVNDAQSVPITKISREKKDLMRQISNKSNSLPENSTLEKNDRVVTGTPPDQTEKVKSKLISVWNNVKYGWTMPTRTNFTVFSPTILLGQVYHDSSESGKLASPPSGNKMPNPKVLGRPLDTPIEKFKMDFMSRIWLTYRRDFPPLNDSTITTDCGWGCMLRGGQMLLAQALICHFLSRSWRCAGILQTDHSETLHRTIVKWFLDSPSEVCPLSLHHLVEIGNKFGKKAGDWFGPSSTAHILKRAIEEASQSSPMLDKICVYVAQDCTIYEDDVIKLCTAPSHVAKIKESSYTSTSNNEVDKGGASRTRKGLTKRNSIPEEVIDWSQVLNSPENEELSESVAVNNGRTSSPPMSPLSRTWSNSFLYESGCGNDLNEVGAASEADGGGNFRSVPVDSRRQSSSLTSCEKWRGLVILVSVRLGGEKLNPIYIPCLKRILAHESCLGIIGGRPKHALYFIGFQDDKLIHLDPHLCQETIDIRNSDFPLSSFHCTVPKKIPIGKMDPSCTIGFYLRTRDDFDAFSSSITPLLLPGSGDLEYPMFVITKGSRSNVQFEHIVEKETLEYVKNGNESDSDDNEEAFVLL